MSVFVRRPRYKPFCATKIQTFCAIFLRRGEKDANKLKKPEKLKKLKKATGAFAPAAF